MTVLEVQTVMCSIRSSALVVNALFHVVCSSFQSLVQQLHLENQQAGPARRFILDSKS